MSRRIYDLPGAAEYLAVGERMMRRLVAERRLAFHRVGRHLRFDERDLDAFLDANRVETAGARVAASRHLSAVAEAGPTRQDRPKAAPSSPSAPHQGSRTRTTVP